MPSRQSKAIVIDARTIRWSGFGRYVEGLLRNLQRLDPDNHYTVLMLPEDRQHWQPSAPNFRVVEVPYRPYSIQEQLFLPGLLRQLAPDLVHFTNPAVPTLYRGRFVTTVHDLTLLDFGSARPGQRSYTIKQEVFRKVLQRAVNRSAALLVPTQYGKDQLAQRYGRAPKDIHVTPEAAFQALPKAATPLPIQTPFVLYVGNYYEYKNVGRLIQAFGMLAKDLPRLKLVLTGKPERFKPSIQHTAQKAGVSDRVVWTGFVSDSELTWLYQNAELFVFPSLSEGFGLPGLEAMQHGLPVTAANASCLPEVYGSAAVYFDPHDPAEIARVISRTLNDPKKLAALQKAGAGRVKQYSWQRLAEQTLAVYKSVLSS